jgi:hypothetical protein
MSTAIHQSTVTPAQLAHQLTPYGFWGDLGGTVGQPAVTPQLSQLSQLGQLGQIGQLGHVGQVGAFGQPATGQPGIVGQFGQRMSPFAGITPQTQINPIALICEYIAVQQVASTIASQLISALLPAVQQSQYQYAGLR